MEQPQPVTGDGTAVHSDLSPPSAGTTPLLDVASTRGRTRSAPTPNLARPSPPSTPPTRTPTPTTLTRSPRHHARLHAYAGTNKPSWGLPEFDRDDSVLVLTASNGVGLARFLDPACCVAAYRGGRMHDIVRILESQPLPPSIHTIVIAVGLNDRLAVQPPFINAATRLRELIDHQTRRVLILPVPHISNAPRRLREATARINLILREALEGTDTVREWPADLVCHPSRLEDVSHFDANTLRLIAGHISHLVRLPLN